MLWLPLLVTFAQMEGMVTDLQLARDKQAVFAEWMRSQGKTLAVDMTVTVWQRSHVRTDWGGHLVCLLGSGSGR
jgi:hypothetical protein